MLSTNIRALMAGIHAIADAQGKPLAFLLTPGQAADCRAAETLLDGLPARCIVHADRAYDTNRIGDRNDVADVYRVARADVVKHGIGPDPRGPIERPLGKGPRDIYIPDLRLGSGIIPGQPTEGIKIKPRDFR